MAKILSLVFIILLAAAPVLAVEPGPGSTLENTGQSEQGAKRLTPLLDLLGDELEQLGIRLSDSVVDSMEKLWQDTVTTIKLKKSKT